MTRKPTPSLKSRAIGLKGLIADGLKIGFASSLIGSYKGQLKAVENEISDDEAKKKIFKQSRGITSPTPFYNSPCCMRGKHNTKEQKLKVFFRSPQLIITPLKVISIKNYRVDEKGGLNPPFFYEFLLKRFDCLRLL